MEGIEVISIVGLGLALAYIIGRMTYTYRGYRNGEYNVLEFVDLEPNSILKSASCKIEPVQVYLLGNELNISLLGLAVNSEIVIMNYKGEVVYSITTDKCNGNIALPISKWKKGTYIFSYIDAGVPAENKKYISGVFEV